MNGTVEPSASSRTTAATLASGKPSAAAMSGAGSYLASAMAAASRTKSRPAIASARVAPVVVDPKRIKAFPSEKAFESWLAKHHDKDSELWLRIYKKDSGVATVTRDEAVDVALCWGW